MRIGLIARSDNTGLGMQTWEFYRHMPVEKAMVIDISHLNGNQVFPERYPERSVFVHGFPSNEQVDAFLEGLDMVFIAEAAYNPYLYEAARQRGVKTAVQYNWEFFDWYNPKMPKPDMFIAPSQWHYDEVDKWAKAQNVEHIYLHCPVDREKFPYRVNKQARTFLHLAGRPAAHDRNGTETVIVAAQLLKTPAKIKIHFQGEQGLAHQATHKLDHYMAMIEMADVGIEVSYEKVDNYQDIYSGADVLVLPRRYGGNCLPLNEALSLGMPVIMPDIDPNNKWLPKRWLISAERNGSFSPRKEFEVDIYDSDPMELAERIDAMYSMGDQDFWYENAVADMFAKSIDWNVMRDRYMKAFEELCQ